MSTPRPDADPIAFRILDTLPQGIFWKDRDSVYLGCNATFARLLGLDHPRDVIGLTDFELPLPREHAEAYRAADRAVIESGQPFPSLVEPLHLVDGAQHWVETTKVPLHDEAGRVIGVLGHYHDVTDRRRERADLHQTRLMLRLVLDHIPVRVFWKDLESVYQGCNLLFARDAGLEHPDEIVGRSDLDLGWPDEADLYRRDDRAVMDSDQPKVGYEETQTTPDGGRIWLRTSKTPLHDLDGQVVGVLGTYEDITASKEAEAEQRHLEAQIQHAQKLESLGILAGGIAHDFNNLLMAMLGHADLALAELPSSSPGRAHVREIHTAARRARELTNQMLAYSGKGHFVVRRLALGEIVREMGDLLEAAISKKVHLRYDLAADLPVVEGDATQLRQVVMNLVTNAAEAIGDRPGTIGLATGFMQASAEYLETPYLHEAPSPGDFVYVEVDDDGCGMDADTAARLFEPFFTTKFQGRGLGLAAVVGIVRGHGGVIKVASEPGRGTTIRVLLPACGAAVAPEPEQSSTSPGVSLRGTVLVVDDESAVRQVARQMLERCGLTVVTASDGAEALAVYRERGRDIALVLLDMTMPRMDGPETYRALQELDPGVRVLLASGYDEHETTGRFADQGLAGFIQKPFTMATLAARVRASLAAEQGAAGLPSREGSTNDPPDPVK